MSTHAHDRGGVPAERDGKADSAVLHVGGLHYASEKGVVERVLAGRPGVEAVEANPVAQTATAGMSMAQMVRDMRDRFLVALIFAVPMAVWSPMGESLFGSTPPTPFGMRDSLWQFFLSLPVVFYSSQVFFTGAYKALRAKTLDMMVLVAVAIGTGWIYSVAACGVRIFGRRGTLVGLASLR